MTEEQKAAYVNAQSVAALIELQAMLAANTVRAIEGYPIAYGEAEMMKLMDKYMLHHNTLISIFHGD